MAALIKKASAPTKKMEQGLLHTDLIEWPSVRFLQECHRIYNEKELRTGARPDHIISLFRMFDIFRAICEVIAAQLIRNKGTKIDGIGTITLDVSNDPCFFPDPMFEKCYDIKGNKRPIRGSVHNQSVQFTAVGAATREETARDDTERVLEMIANGLRWALDHDIPSLSLQLGFIGDLVVGESSGGSKVVGVRFSEELVSSVKEAHRAHDEVCFR
jgi:hypothetical protein